jgi:hypothetical protein
MNFSLEAPGLQPMASSAVGLERLSRPLRLSPFLDELRGSNRAEHPKHHPCGSRSGGKVEGSPLGSPFPLEPSQGQQTGSTQPADPAFAHHRPKAASTALPAVDDHASRRLSVSPAGPDRFHQAQTGIRRKQAASRGETSSTAT